MLKIIFAILIFSPNLFASTKIDQIKEFGSNPGNLDMYLFSPSNPSNNSAVLLLLHGCTQEAKGFAKTSGWLKYAQEQRFFVIMPEQKHANNRKQCFNWFKRQDTKHGLGEVESIIQMLDYV